MSFCETDRPPFAVDHVPYLRLSVLHLGGPISSAPLVQSRETGVRQTMKSLHCGELEPVEVGACSLVGFVTSHSHAVFDINNSGRGLASPHSLASCSRTA